MFCLLHVSKHAFYKWFQNVGIKKSLKIPKGGNHDLQIEEEQTTQWPKEKVLKDKQ